jgi:hypothetical protein
VKIASFLCFLVYAVNFTASKMPYGASPREFGLTLAAAFLSAAAGSSLVHTIMKPSEDSIDFSDEVEARSKAVREMQMELDHNEGRYSVLGIV